MLIDAKNDCLAAAALLPAIEVNGKITNRYEDYDITDLANKYCEAIDAGDAYNMNLYISALILRFWYTIDKMYQKCKTAGIDREDLFFKLYECINVACEYRAWQDESKKTNAQACINQVIASRGAAAVMYESNLEKNKIKFATSSLDEPLDKTDAESDTRGANLTDTDYKDTSGTAATIAIQEFVDRGQLVEAIILDTIATRDVFKHEKKTIKEINENGEISRYTEHTSEFWPFKLVQELNDLGDDYEEYFLSKYATTLDKFQSAYTAMQKATNSKKYKFIDLSLESARKLLNLQN